MAIIAYFSGAVVLGITDLIVPAGSILSGLLIEIPAVLALGAGSWWFVLPEWFRAEDSPGQGVFSEKTLIRFGFVVWIAATLGVTSFYNITQGVFQLSLPYPQIPYWRGVLSLGGMLSLGAGALLSRRRFAEPTFMNHRIEAAIHVPWTPGRILKRLGPGMVFFGVYFGLFGSYLVYLALTLLVAGMLAYTLGRLMERWSKPERH